MQSNTLINTNKLNFQILPTNSKVNSLGIKTVPVSSLPFNYLKGCQDWTGDALGQEQAPIDIVPTNSKPSDDSMKMQFFLTDHTLNGLKVEDLGTTLMVNGSFSKLIATDVDGDTYEFEAIQFHFHAPSEHTINGKHYDLELHIVHQMTPESAKNAKTHRNLAVVGVFFDLSADKPHALFEDLQLHDIGSDISLNMYDLLGDDLVDRMTFHAYKGSLTTPPCTQNANFFIIEKALPINQEQYDHFHLRWAGNPEFANGKGNNRPVQPLNGRTVKCSTNCCVGPRSEEALLKMKQKQTEETEEKAHNELAKDLEGFVFEAPNLESTHLTQEYLQETDTKKTELTMKV